MSEFIAYHGAVWMVSTHAPVRLSEESVETLLDIFEREGAGRAFNSLYAANMAAGGIPRTTSMRSAA